MVRCYSSRFLSYYLLTSAHAFEPSRWRAQSSGCALILPHADAASGFALVRSGEPITPALAIMVGLLLELVQPALRSVRFGGHEVAVPLVLLAYVLVLCGLSLVLLILLVLPLLPVLSVLGVRRAVRGANTAQSRRQPRAHGAWRGVWACAH